MHSITADEIASIHSAHDEMNRAPTEDVSSGSRSNVSSPRTPRRSATPQQSGQIQNSNQPNMHFWAPTTILNIGSGSFNATSHAGMLFSPRTVSIVDMTNTIYCYLTFYSFEWALPFFLLPNKTILLQK